MPLMAIGLESFGWRYMAILSGVVILAAGLPLVSLIHHRPSDKGLTIDGYGQKATGQTTTEDKAPIRSFTWREAIKELSLIHI